MRTMPTLDEKYIKTGKIRYFVRDFPLEPIHPHAERWAEATHCAGEIGRYWELRSSLFTHQDEANMESALATAIPFSDRGAFDKCMLEGRFASRVRADVAEGKRLGVTGTPEFLIGYIDTSQPYEFKGVRRLRGAASVDDFAAAIDSMQAGAELKETTGKSPIEAAKDQLMPQSVFGAFRGKPVPIVQVEDLKRVWSFLSEQVRDAHSIGVPAVDVKLLTDLCGPNANVLAVFFRATLITALLQGGQLDQWRDANSLRDKVFELAASFPLPQGLENADVEAFLAALK